MNSPLAFATVAVVLATVVSWTFGEDLIERSPQDVRDLNELLRRRDVQRDLQMTRAQIVKVRNSSHAANDLVSQLQLEMPTLTTLEIAEFQHQIELKKLKAAIDQLTAEQMLRLDQLKIQYQVLRDGFPSVISRVTELSDEQRASLEDRQAALGLELRDLMWNFYRKSQQQLMQGLTPEQKAAWRQAVQDEFRFDSVYAGLSLLGGLL